MHVDVRGKRFSSEDGQFLKSKTGAWYSLMTDFKWRPYKMCARVESRLQLVEEFATISVWRRG